ncbi:MAG: CarD family transcriptional regulator [Actinobacteria bacterium]|nr:CarD family transcriptional regulator [Actinomycetota bacterium]
MDFQVGDSVVSPHHGAGEVVRKEKMEVVGQKREYLTIRIHHNDMTILLPSDNAAENGLRPVMDDKTLKKLLRLINAECSEMPKNWNRRFKHNRDKLKTGDVFEIAEVVRNLAVRETDKGLSTGEKQMFTKAKTNLASELQYALSMEDEEAEEHLDNLLAKSNGHKTAAAAG